MANGAQAINVGPNRWVPADGVAAPTVSCCTVAIVGQPPIMLG